MQNKLADNQLLTNLKLPPCATSQTRHTLETTESSYINTITFFMSSQSMFINILLFFLMFKFYYNELH